MDAVRGAHTDEIRLAEKLDHTVGKIHAISDRHYCGHICPTSAIVTQMISLAEQRDEIMRPDHREGPDARLHH